MEDGPLATGSAGSTGGNGDHPHRDLLLKRLSALREKLLDLSNRNRLISFKHSDRARTHIRVIDELPDVLFATLRNGRRMRFKALPEPQAEPPDEDTGAFLMELEAARATDQEYKEAMERLTEEELSSGKEQQIVRSLRDRVRARLGMTPWVDESALSKEEFARHHGLEPSYELPVPLGDGDDPDRHVDNEIQTLLYPREMDRKLSGIVDQARTMLEEAGISTLRVAFGFLEWREADHAETKHLSPILLLPATVEQKKAHPWRRFNIYGDVGEIEANQTLAIRLERDTAFGLPEFDEDDTPESYLGKVAKVVASRTHWRVHRFVTIGNFGFSKLSMYNDLDPKSWTGDKGLVEHSLIRKILLGEERTDSDPFEAPDHEVDSAAVDARQLDLITDADASQHSAIIDAVDGKNLVIMGPPGTGKSQTITNIIAASLSAGKKILFVAEKMAALDVVYSRLQEAGLGDYCLELHSNKTSKAQNLQSLARRLELQNSLSPPDAFAEKLEELRNIRDELNRYVAALNSRIGALDFSVQQVLWGHRRALDDAGPAWEVVKDLSITDALKITQSRRSNVRHAIYDAFVRIENLAQIKGALRDHPWAWLRAHELSPFDLQAAIDHGAEWIAALEKLDDLLDELAGRIGSVFHRSPNELANLANAWRDMAAPSIPVVATLAKFVLDQAMRNPIRELLGNFDATSGNGSAEVRVLTKQALPPLATDWSDLGRDIERAVDTIKTIMPKADTVAAARGEKQMLERDKTLMDRILILSETVQSAAKLATDHSGETALAALCAARLYAELPYESRLKREPSLLDEAAETVIAGARERARHLASKKLALEQTFVLEPLPKLEEANVHARNLRAAGAVSALSSNVRGAKKFFRLIAKRGVKANADERAKLLTELAAYLDARSRLEVDTQLAATCGRWFEGSDTDFEALSEIPAWARRVRQQFPTTTAGNSALRILLLEGKVEDLETVSAALAGLDLDLAQVLLERCGDGSADIRVLSNKLTVGLQAIEQAFDTLTNAGVTEEAPLQSVRELSGHISKLEPLRRAVLMERPEADGVLTFHTVREALQLAERVSEIELPSETTSALLTGDVESGFVALKFWADRALEALADERACRLKFAELVQLDPHGFAGVDNLGEVPLQTALTKVREAMAHGTALGHWVDFVRAKAKAGANGLEQLIDRLVDHEVGPENGIAAYDALLYRELTKASYEQVPEIQEFDGISIEQARKRFQELDREILNLHKGKIQAELCYASVSAGVGVGLKRDYTDLALGSVEIHREFIIAEQI